MAKAPCFFFFFLVKREKKRPKSLQFFQFRFVCGILFLNHLAPPSKGELMPNAPCFFFFWLRVQVTSLNLIAFIISIESKASLLALAKSIYYPWYCSLYLCCMSVSV